MSEISYRWIEGGTATDAEWEAIDRLLSSRQWMSLSRAFSEVEVAEIDGKIVGISCLQGVPFCGPLLVVPEYRGTGIAEKLADDTIGRLMEAKARGWIVVADSPHVPKLCMRNGMRKIESPVFVSGAK